uniref:Cation efflux protein transmembrane domain-containing protein n=1 Tax=Entomoneis paludosa TaxID=265537 RepID=A0A7S2Y3Y6_9STRA|mmetsp:Transcript_14605/g.30173  ORF Transcript_14605/g.30173 Transcript_14605/m.30173 type:complete len:452 (+) Transcript_14605:269-1624(+)
MSSNFNDGVPSTNGDAAQRSTSDIDDIPDDTKKSQRIALEVSPPSPLLSFASSRSDMEDHDEDTLVGGSGVSAPFRLNDNSQSFESQIVSQDVGRPSNTMLLATAFVSFLSFALIQMVFAFMAGSQAMKGDSAAMIVDSMTYLFNWAAERRKAQFDQEYDHVVNISPSYEEDAEEGQDPSSDAAHVERAEQIRIRTRRQVFLKLEIIPPIISVSCLMVITIIVFYNALQVLILDIKRSESEQTDPNIHLMMGFSVVNLILDAVNVSCFARAKHLMGFQTKEEHEHHVSNHENHHERDSSTIPSSSSATTSIRDTQSYMQLHQELHEAHQCECDEFTRMSDAQEDREDEQANLNMCSAYTHVFADTLRSLAVIVAALVAELSDGVTSEEADAAAAIAVSVLIFLSLIPLFQGLSDSVMELRIIQCEEEQDREEEERRSLSRERSNRLTLGPT